MKIREPLTHWENFSLSALKKILEHCQALDELGIAQDEEMIHDIQRDLTLREKKSMDYEFKPKIVRKPSKNPMQKRKFLLEQTV